MSTYVSHTYVDGQWVGTTVRIDYPVKDKIEFTKSEAIPNEAEAMRLAEKWVERKKSDLEL